MATTLPDITARVRLDTSALGSAVGHVGKSTSRMAGSFARLGRAAGFAAGAAGVGALAVVFKTGFDEVSDYQKGLAQANAVIRSTGGTANVTASHVEKLASTIQGYSGQSDDSVVAAENMLLTFRNLRDEAGKGNDAFTQATKVAADMATAFGTDAVSQSIRLGKALNDPVKGVSALTRVGVTFDDKQKATIKRLVETGDTLGAQKIILKELNAEFGGSAKAFGETMPGQIARAKRAFEDFSQSVVMAVLPPLLDLGERIAPKVRAFFSTTRDVIEGFMGAFTGRGSDALNNFSGPTMNRIIDAAGKARSVWDALSKTFSDHVFPIVKQVAGVLRDVLAKVMTTLTGVVAGHLLPALASIGDAMRGQLLPVLRDVADFFTGTVVPVLGGVLSKAIDIVSELLTKHLIPAFAAIVTVIRQDVMPIVVQIVAFVADKLAPALAAVLGAALDAARKAFIRIGNALHDHQKEINQILAVLKTLAGWILAVAVPLLKVTFKVAFEILGRSISATITVIADLVKGVRGFITVGRQMVAFIADKILAALEWIVKGAASAFGWVPGLGGKLKSAAKKVEQFRNDVNEALSGIHDKNVVIHLTEKVKQAQTTKLGRFDKQVDARAGGGRVSARVPYLVGERRPEVFVPDTAGRIVPSVREWAAGGSAGLVAEVRALRRDLAAHPALTGAATADALNGVARSARHTGRTR